MLKEREGKEKRLRRKGRSGLIKTGFGLI